MMRAPVMPSRTQTHSSLRACHLVVTCPPPSSSSASSSSSNCMESSVEQHLALNSLTRVCAPNHHRRRRRRFIYLAAHSTYICIYIKFWTPHTRSHKNSSSGGEGIGVGFINRDAESLAARRDQLLV